MWKPLLQNNNLSVLADVANKQILMHIHPQQHQKTAQLHNRETAQLQLEETDFFELMYTFLAINREFQGEKPYFAD